MGVEVQGMCVLQAAGLAVVNSRSCRTRRRERSELRPVLLAQVEVPSDRRSAAGPECESSSWMRPAGIAIRLLSGL